MDIGFSATENVFFILDLQQRYEANGSWAKDVTPVTNDIWETYSGCPPAGKKRAVGNNGMPVWEDLPMMCAAEQCTYDLSEKEKRLRNAEQEIFRLSIIKDLGKLNSAEEIRLRLWKEHFEKIYRTDPSLGKVESWPSAPEI